MAEFDQLLKSLYDEGYDEIDAVLILADKFPQFRDRAFTTQISLDRICEGGHENLIREALKRNLTTPSKLLNSECFPSILRQGLYQIVDFLVRSISKTQFKKIIQNLNVNDAFWQDDQFYIWLNQYLSAKDVYGSINNFLAHAEEGNVYPLRMIRWLTESFGRFDFDLDQHVVLIDNRIEDLQWASQFYGADQVYTKNSLEPFLFDFLKVTFDEIDNLRADNLLPEIDSKTYPFLTALLKIYRQQTSPTQEDEEVDFDQIDRWEHDLKISIFIISQNKTKINHILDDLFEESVMLPTVLERWIKSI